MKKIFVISIIVFNLLAIFYLITPTPELPPLPNSLRSDEPGDTIQLKNVSAYYTNLTRTEVINFYRVYYNGFNRKIINHPPEKAREIIKDTIQTYYLEEFVLPYKESLFINGYEWENDVFTKVESRPKNRLLYKGKEFKSKITLKTIPTTLYSRLLILLVSELSIFTIYRLYRYFLKKHQ